MSIAAHLDALDVYRALAVRIVPTEGEPEDLVGEGGGLEEAFERVGQRPLLAVLRDSRVRQVVLGDGELTIEAERLGQAGRLQVRWGRQVVVDEEVEIPLAAPVENVRLFRPDPETAVGDLKAALHEPGAPLYAVRDIGGRLRWYRGGLHGPGVGAMPLAGMVPAVDPARLGSRWFREAHGVGHAYVAGAMAGGIASAELVLAMAHAGMLGFFGAGGLPLEQVEAALQRVSSEVGEGSWGFNLLHNPAEPDVEEHTVDLYLKYGVPRVSASAYMELTPAVARYRLAGIAAGPDGRPVCRQKVLAKVSRPEVAEKFLRPAPDAILEKLRADGVLSAEQVELARRVPVAEDVTAEADSGGHTDRRPLVVLLPVLQRLRDRVAAEFGWTGPQRPRVGAAGGIGTPASAWAAFAMGADYILTGSVNQSALEAGTSRVAKEMLAEADFADVTTGPAPDMFEIGAHVQVLGRGTMYAQRAKKLYDLYRGYAAMEEIPSSERSRIEKQIFRRSLEEVWTDTRAYWEARDARQVERAEKDSRHKMALVFRSYLGLTSRWARIGEEDRRRDFQMWCGPAMGGFNDWVRGSALEPLEGRSVVAIAHALLNGAAACARVADARTQGLDLPEDADAVGVIG